MADAGAFTLANFQSVTFNGTNGMGSDQPDATAATVNGLLQMQGATYGAATVSVDGGTLSGNGQLSGDVTLSAGASIEPGSSIGVLSVGSLTMAAGTNYNAEVSGSARDQIDSAGAVSLGGATLDVSGTPNKNATFIIINNGGGAVNGIFNGLAEGDTFTSSGHEYEITYAGGDGNDVVLTALTGDSGELICGAMAHPSQMAMPRPPVLITLISEMWSCQAAAWSAPLLSPIRAPQIST